MEDRVKKSTKQQESVQPNLNITLTSEPVSHTPNTGLKHTSTRVHNLTKEQIEARKSTREQNEIALKKQRDKDRQIVTGRFEFKERPGATLKFPFKEYKWDPIETYELKDGEIYSIPLGVAKHLNKRGWYNVHKYALDENNKKSVRVGQKVRRFSFQSLEFIDDLAPEKELITIEHI